ncbi:uncharacterized protein DUF945 [Pseudoduganella flava]|nr:uncharacterized protein DUF945 [Pseudoduganella flava]
MLAAATFGSAAAAEPPAAATPTDPVALAAEAARDAADAAETARRAHAEDARLRAEGQRALQGLSLQLQRHVDPLAKQQAPTTDQLDAMERVFKSRQPLRVELLSKRGAPKRQRLTLPAGAYTGIDGTTTWQPLTWQVNHSADARRMDSTFVWPGAVHAQAKGTLTVQDAAGKSQQRRGTDGLWFGRTHFTAENVRFEAPNSPPADFIHLRGRSTTSPAGKSMHQDYDMLVERLKVADFTLEQLHMAFQLRNLDRAAVARIAQTEAGDKDLVYAQLKQLALSGAELRIDDISARYKGHTASVHGTVALPGVTNDDFSSVAKLTRKLKFRFDAKVPLPLVREIATAFAARNTAKGAPTAEQLYAGIVGKAVGDGWARVEADALLTSIEWRDGSLVINGKPVELPQAAKAALVVVPPADPQPPQRLSMATRPADSLLAHALNGHPMALAAQCRREVERGADATDTAFDWCRKAADKDMPEAFGQLAVLYDRTGDKAQAEAWRRRAASAEPELPRDELEHGGSEVLRQRAGEWDISEFRFDPRFARDLLVSMETPRKHDKWVPVLSLCVAAEAPSDRVCLAMSRYGDDTQLAVTKRVQSQLVDKPQQRLDAEAALGMSHHVRVYVRDDVVYFELNGNRVIAEPVGFPVEVIELGCSTADCRFSFIPPAP